MANEELDIEISPDGKVSVHPKNVKGERCKHWAEIFEEIVGREESKILSSEYYQATHEVRQQQDVKQHR